MSQKNADISTGQTWCDRAYNLLIEMRDQVVTMQKVTAPANIAVGSHQKHGAVTAITLGKGPFCIVIAS